MGEEEKVGFRLLDLDDEEAGIYAYAVDEGHMSQEDVAPLWSRFDEAKAGGRKLRIYSEYHGIPSFEGGMVLDKLKRMGTILSTIERMAIVGDKGWMALYQKVVNPITPMEIRHFTFAQKDEAAAWIRG